MHIFVQIQESQFFENILGCAEKKQNIKGIFANSIFEKDNGIERKWLYCVLLYFINIIELHTRCFCKSGIKIKHSDLAKGSFSMEHPMLISFMKKLKISFHSKLGCQLKGK